MLVGDLHRVIPLIEIEIASVPLYFASLKVNGFAARVLLLGYERLSIVVVDYHAPGVDSA